MRNEVMYEWGIELIDVYGDIIETNFRDKLAEYSESELEDLKEPRNCLVLLRREGNEVDGETDRVYAYVKDGELPECFSDESGNEFPAMKVPKKLHKEYQTFKNKIQ